MPTWRLRTSDRCFSASRQARCSAIFPSKCLQPDGALMSYTVTLRRTGGNQTFTGTIYLRDYDKDGMPTGEPFGTLVRNHDYQFIIRLSPLELLVSVQKWRFGGKVHIDLE